MAAAALLLVLFTTTASASADEYTVPSETIEQVFHRLSTEPLDAFVEELPRIPNILGYEQRDGKIFPRNLTIGMYAKKWSFHRDLPDTPVFVYGESEETASFPGPTIEAIQGVPTYITWENHLPLHHILPVDDTLPIPQSTTGVPAVVHLHGGVVAPDSDGSNYAWFTADFAEKGEKWTRSTYEYPNVQHPGNLLYHDHAFGITRLNILAGLFGNYVIRNLSLDEELNLPRGEGFDRHLVIADRDFNADGTIFMNTTGMNPEIHPMWRPEYYGDLITVNGKIWPSLKVQRRKYRFRIVNACNARYLNITLSNEKPFIVVGSDGTHLGRPVKTPKLVIGATEIFDVVIDFNEVSGDELQIVNSNPNPNRAGIEGKEALVMKFLIQTENVLDPFHVPDQLIKYSGLNKEENKIAATRYISFAEHYSDANLRTHLSINGLTLYDPVTETPKSGTTEEWYLINLTIDSHPLHIHLGTMQAAGDSYDIGDLENFKICMNATGYDGAKCNVHGLLTGVHAETPEYEKTWKNVVKVSSGCMLRVIVKFYLVETNSKYPFDATKSPHYVYHCHTLDHEDNIMSRPLMIV